MDALDMLRLQIEWGADEALEDAPVDRLRPPPPARAVAPRVRVTQPQSAERVPSPLAAGTPAERAIRTAAQAGTLEELRGAIAGFEGDPLRDMATNMVFVTGNPNAGLLLIGGAPGADEDRSGLPFAGREGALLDQMLESVGLKREVMLLAPLIPWRPPGGRVPNPGELQLYRPFLARLIKLAAPARIVLFGALAANVVAGAGPRGRMVGWVEKSIEGEPRRLLTLPALTDLPKTPARRREAWMGMRALRRELDTRDRVDSPSENIL